MTAPDPVAALREEVAGVLLAHHPRGFVNSRDRWIECRCGERLPCSLDSDGYSHPAGESTARANHLAAALLAHLAPLVEARERVEALADEYERREDTLGLWSGGSVALTIRAALTPTEERP